MKFYLQSVSPNHNQILQTATRLQKEDSLADAILATSIETIIEWYRFQQTTSEVRQTDTIVDSSPQQIADSLAGRSNI